MNPQINFEQRTENCAKHGAFTSKHTIFGHVDFWDRCPECERDANRRRDEEEKRRSHEELIARLVKAARIPQRFQGKGFNDYKAKNSDQRDALLVARTYAEEFEQRLAAGRCLVFCGKPGTGKTHLACAIAETAARSGRSVEYSTVTELIRRIRATWNDYSQDENSVLQKLAARSLLILDEVGVQFGTDAEVMQLTELLDLRYREMKPTLVVSNCIATELGKYLGDRGVDRLRENGGKVVIFDWESHRGTNAN